MAWNTQYGNEVRAKYNYESNLFRQVERINTAQTVEQKIMNIETLEALLQPYKDDTFRNNLEKLKEKAREDMKKSRKRYGKIEERDFMKKRYKMAWVKYKELMNLAYRKGFLPQHGIKKKVVGKRGKNK